MTAQLDMAANCIGVGSTLALMVFFMLRRLTYCWLYPEKSLAALLDEAGMRFNLNPLDAAALGRLFDPATQEKND